MELDVYLGTLCLLGVFTFIWNFYIYLALLCEAVAWIRLSASTTTDDKSDLLVKLRDRLTKSPRAGGKRGQRAYGAPHPIFLQGYKQNLLLQNALDCNVH